MRKTLLAGLMICAGAAQAQEGLIHTLEIGQHERLVKVMTDRDPVPFTTDGCSGGLSVGWSFFAETFPAFADVHGAHPPWEDCCFTHDRAYHDPAAMMSEMSAEGSYAARLAADETLSACVKATSSSQTEALQEAYGLSEAGVQMVFDAIAGTMFDAVRLGGGPCTLLPWRWGYGYPLCIQARAD